MSYYITKQTKANSPTNKPSSKNIQMQPYSEGFLRPIPIDF